METFQQKAYDQTSRTLQRTETAAELSAGMVDIGGAVPEHSELHAVHEIYAH